MRATVLRPSLVTVCFRELGATLSLEGGTGMNGPRRAVESSRQEESKNAICYFGSPRGGVGGQWKRSSKSCTMTR